MFTHRASGRALARGIVGVLSIAALHLASPTHASVLGPVIAEPVQALAASGDAIAALVSNERGRQVVVLARGGGWPAVVSRWPDAAAWAHRQDAIERAHQADVDDVVSLYEMADADRDAPEFEDLLDEEGVDETPRRRRSSEPEPLLPRALAAEATTIWLASSQGVWRLPTTPAQRRWQPRGLGERALTLIAVGRTSDGGMVVAAASGDGIWRSDDDGASWRLVGVTSSPPRALAVAPGGDELLVADDDGLWAVAAHRAARRLIDDRVTDVAVCHQQAVVLTTSGVYGLRAPDAAPERLSGALPARAIRCAGDGAGPWIATGSQPMISRDDGRTWAPLGDAFGEASAAAVDDDELWLGSGEGLFVAPLGPTSTADPALIDPRGLAPGEPDTARLLVRAIADPPPWTRLLPHVSVLGSADVASTGRRNLRAMMVLTIPLARVRPSQARALAAEILRRRTAATAAEQRQAAMAPDPP